MPAELHIGMDAEKTVVSPYAIKLRTGRCRRERAGTVTEMVPRPPSGVSRDELLTFVARLSLPLFFLGALLFAFGVPWWLPAAGSAALLGTIWHRQRRAAQRASFRLPAEPEAKILLAAPERAAYDRAVVVSRRVRRTWPALTGMIDPVEADRSLTLALDDLAGIMVRRQEIRRVRASLAEVRANDVPAASPAVLALESQRANADRLWRETGEQANRILRGIDGAARAGEAFVREQRVGETARRAELVLAGLTAAAPPVEAAPDLAERTAAVITAYRELAATGQH